MAHIHTDPGHHDLTTSAFVVRLDLPEPVILMHVHNVNGTWMQFGGHVELHENPWQALLREIQEESGYELSQLRLLQPDIDLPRLSDAVAHPWPVAILTVKIGDLDHYHTDIAYAFTASGPPANKPNEKESQELRPFTREELENLGDDKIISNVKETSLLVLDRYKGWNQSPLD